MYICTKTRPKKKRGKKTKKTSPIPVKALCPLKVFRYDDSELILLLFPGSVSVGVYWLRI